MDKKIPIKKKTILDLDAYINASTGEYMSSENEGKGLRISMVESTEKSVVTYDNYAVISSEAVDVLQSVLNDSDLGKVMKMSLTIKTDLSILFNENIPHTNKTLQQYLKIKSEAMYIGLIKRLMRAGVLYQIKGLIWGEVRVIYMINPYICRKRKIFGNRVLEVFRKFESN
jgi:hypothetical protein